MPAATAPLTTIDAYLDGRVMIEQPARGYRAGLDAVLLAAAAGVRPDGHARVLDVGAGVGVAGLCVAGRVEDARVVLVEREPEFVALAQANITRNRFDDRASALALDVATGGAALHRRNAERAAEADPLRPAAFTHAIANPPYHAPGRSSAARTALKTAAHQMADDDLSAWVRFMVTALATDGIATIIHRADALALLLAQMDGRLGALRVLPIHARPGGPATRVIVQGIKGSRAPLAIVHGLVLHEATGNAYRPEIDAILRRGAAIDLSDRAGHARRLDL